METLYYSFIIPVYNRPDEIKELLESLNNLEQSVSFEVVIVEDGSTLDCKAVVDNFKHELKISYYYKPNTGPGDSRNYGMSMAKGNYFIILDSDCVLPKQYLKIVNTFLLDDYVDCYGGPDAAHVSFSNLQKAINFAMTSFITTGGIRGSKANNKKFQPRSFNMGLSKNAFIASGGFGNIHPGEDPDLSIRLVNLGFETKLISDAFVYHKRRISWRKFYNQVYKFGLVRPILNFWHPETERMIFWFPTVFSLGFIIAIIALFFYYNKLFLCYLIYLVIAFILALYRTKSLSVALNAIFAIFIQFFGYGFGFLKSTFAIKILNKDPKRYFSDLFFNHAN
ncbi:glycosyltransferase [uncultured Psychroserpens sp.]|uniref:glycosyltransferase n=1 Tax=uncultured Psychroserpens sp. TaxID=255436 RepID=UPI002607D2B7|nr:glycosyltransferase [uncultured Psychroserpens sp.]